MAGHRHADLFQVVAAGGGTSRLAGLLDRRQQQGRSLHQAALARRSLDRRAETEFGARLGDLRTVQSRLNRTQHRGGQRILLLELSDLLLAQYHGTLESRLGQLGSGLIGGQSLQLNRTDSTTETLDAKTQALELAVETQQGLDGRMLSRRRVLHVRGQRNRHRLGQRHRHDQVLATVDKCQVGARCVRVAGGDQLLDESLDAEDQRLLVGLVHQHTRHTRLLDRKGIHRLPIQRRLLELALDRRQLLGRHRRLQVKHRRGYDFFQHQLRHRRLIHFAIWRRGHQLGHVRNPADPQRDLRDLVESKHSLLLQLVQCLLETGTDRRVLECLLGLGRFPHLAQVG